MEKFDCKCLIVVVTILIVKGSVQIIQVHFLSVIFPKTQDCGLGCTKKLHFF